MGTQIVNCVFTGNEADYGGAVEMCRNDDTTRLTNCTFYKNTAGSDGGALHAGEAYPRILNCILWGNEASGDGNDIYLTRSAKHTTFRHCDVNECGGSGDNWDNDNFGMDAGGNIDSDPYFYIDDLEWPAEDGPEGPDGTWATADDGLRLDFDTSPCIDAADGDAAPVRDITGWLRFDMSVSGTGTGEPDYADIGAYEAPSDLRVVVMCWINETEDTGYQALPNEVYEDDLKAYNDLVETLNTVKSGCYVPPYPIDGEDPGDIAKVLPIGYPEPEGITMDTFPGSDDIVLSDFTSRFNNLVQGGIVPDYVLLIVDNSDSMVTENIEPHYSQATEDNFKEWIKPENYPNAILKVRDAPYGSPGAFENERWLEAMRLLLEDVLEEL